MVSLDMKKDYDDYGNDFFGSDEGDQPDCSLLFFEFWIPEGSIAGIGMIDF